MDADARLAEIRAREQAAHDGPWTVERDDPSLSRWVVSEHGLLSANLGYLGNNNQADAEFIAHARTDIPFLLAQITARDALIQELSSQLATRDDQVTDLDTRLAEAQHSLDASTSDEQAGAPA